VKVFRIVTITCIADVIRNVQPVVFPSDHFIPAQEITQLKRQVRQNCDAVISYVQHVLPTAKPGSYHETILQELRADVLRARQECGRVNENFSGAKHRSKLTQLHAAYEELRLTAILVCQKAEPELMDSLAVSL
jgi:hypothetical protein